METNSVTHDRLLQLLEELLQHQIDGGQQAPATHMGSSQQTTD